MKQVKEIIDSLGNSKAIFKVEVSSSKRAIGLTLKDEYQPIAATDDPVEKLVVEKYNEWFDSSINKMRKSNHIESNVNEFIMSFVRDAYRANCDLKRPHTSAIYKFLTSRNFNINDAVSLYRFLHPNVNTGDNGSSYPIIENKQIKDNFFMVLEKLRKKYGR